MAVGDLDIASFNQGVGNFQEEDTVVTTRFAGQFPTSQFDVIDYDWIYRSGGGRIQQTSILITGLSKT